MAYLWLRDVCKMILELDSLRLYYFNFELRHIVLYDREESNWSSLQNLISDEKIRSGNLSFRLIDFS